MGVFIEQRGHAMGRKIDDDHTAAGPQHPRGLCQNLRRLFRIVQDHVQRHGIEPFVRERQLVHVGMPDLAVAQPVLVQIVPRNGEHLPAEIDADRARHFRRHQFQDPAGAGADIQQVLDRMAEHDLPQRGIDLCRIDVQGADFGPARRVGPEIVRCHPRPFGLDLFETAQVQGLDLVILRDQVDELPGEFGIARAAARLCQAIPGPVAFLVPLQQAGLDQQFEMAGNPGLRLAEDTHQIGNREFDMRAQGEDAQTRPLRRRLQSQKQLIHDRTTPQEMARSRSHQST